MSNNKALPVAVAAQLTVHRFTYLTPRPYAPPVLAWGEPGVGKTAVITAIGDALNVPVEVVIASIREPSDFGGLPVVGEGGVRLHAPAWAQRLAAAQQGILFLDEISTAPPAVQAALLRVVLDRVVGELELPAGVAVVAAANPPEIAAGGWELSPPLANRFVHLQWKVDAADWCEGMVKGFSTPSIPQINETAFPAAYERARALVAAFIRRRPTLLCAVPKTEEAQGRAWPSPRSWHAAATLMAAAEAAGADGEVVSALVAGCVGEAAALEFLQFRRELDLPDPQQVMGNPDLLKGLTGDRMHAALTAVVAHATAELTPEKWAAAWRVLAHAAKIAGKDVAAWCACILARAHKPDLPVPSEVEEFCPLLEAAGLLGGGGK